MDDRRPSGDLVRIRRPATQVEAQSMVIFLEGRGIRAVVGDNAALQGVITAIAGSPYALAPEVFVNREDLEIAERALQEFDQLTRPAEEIEPDPKDELEVRKSWPAWPHCPECSARRTVECPDCGEAGDDFPLAEYQDEEEPLEPAPPPRERPASAEEEREGGATAEASESALAGPRPYLSCPACAHAFRPVFLRLCPQCDHHFEDGRYATPAEKKRPQSLTSFVIGVAIFVIAFAVLYLIFGPQPGRGPEGPAPAKEVLPRVERMGIGTERSSLG